ncbi:MAG: hypothetical protein QXF12_04900 [Candidatus Aenigmatarchaeota archaeon]
MIIRKNIKSKVESRPIKSLSRKKSKSNLSFYSSIERDIRDIEMKLYRIKKALKYYSEDSGQEIDPDEALSLIDAALDKAEEMFVEETPKTRSSFKNIKYRERAYYSSEQIEEVEEQLLKLLKPEFGDIETLAEGKKQAKNYANTMALANAVYNKLGNVKKKINSIAEKVSYGVSAVFTAASAVLMYLSHDDIAKLGEIGNLDHAIRNPEVIIKIAYILATIFGAILSFMIGKGFREKAESAFEESIAHVKSGIRQAARKLLLNPSQDNVQFFESKMEEIHKLIDTNKDKDITQKDFEKLFYPHIDQLEKKLS